MKWVPVEVELPHFEHQVLIHVEGHDGQEFDDIALRADYYKDREGWAGWAWWAERPYALGEWIFPDKVVAWCEIPPYNENEEMNGLDSGGG